jgi:hypothetical protein
MKLDKTGHAFTHGIRAINNEQQVLRLTAKIVAGDTGQQLIFRSIRPKTDQTPMPTGKPRNGQLGQTQCGSFEMINHDHFVFRNVNERK